MHVCVDKLAFEFLLFDAVDEGVGDFIVKSVEDWFDACICEPFVACIITLCKVICASALDWFSWCDIGIVITKCENMTVAFRASKGKHAWEVSACEALQLF